jgi:succinate-acetate transporter protein
VGIPVEQRVHGVVGDLVRGLLDLARSHPAVLRGRRHRDRGAGGFLDAFGTYLLLWAIVSGYCTIAAYFVARPAFLAFLLLTIVFILLGISNIIAPDSPTVGLRKIGGYIGLVDALIAFYISAALLINTTSGKPLLPLWPYPYGGK